MTSRASHLLGLFIIFFPMLTWGAPVVTISSKVNVTQNEVTLGQIARFKGMSDKEKRIASQFVIGPAPSGGTRQQLPRSYLKSKLRSAPLPKGVKWKLPKVLTLTRKQEKVSGKVLAKRIREVIRSRDPSEGRDLALLKVPPLSGLTIPEGATFSIEIKASVRAGRVPVNLKVKDGARVLRSQRVSVEVDYFRTAIALKTQMRSGAVLSAEDLVEVRVPSATLQRDSLSKAFDAVGARLKRSIGKEIPLRNAWLWTPPLIKRGARVQMIFKRKGILLSAEGEALGIGRRGDMIKVRNIKSKKIVTGRVVAVNQVEMEF